jgi:hypothetical protein
VNVFTSVLTKENKTLLPLLNKWKRRGFNQTSRLSIGCRRPGKLWIYSSCLNLKWYCKQRSQKWCLLVCTSLKNSRFQSTNCQLLSQNCKVNGINKSAHKMTWSNFQASACLAALLYSQHRTKSASPSAMSAGTSLRSPNSDF